MNRLMVLGFAAGSLLLWVVGTNAFTTVRLHARVDALEADLAAQTVTIEALRAERRSPRPAFAPRGDDLTRERELARDRVRAVRASDGIAAPVVDLQDPSVRQELEAFVAETRDRQDQARREERSKAMHTAMRAEATAFASERRLSPTQSQAVLDEVDAMHEAFSAIRTEIDRGDLTWMDARGEMQALREDSAARLTALLGAEVYAELEERVLPGGPGSGRGRR